MKRTVGKFISVLMCVLILFGAWGCTSDKETLNDEYAPTSSLSVSEAEVAGLKGKLRICTYYATERGDKIAAEYKLASFSSKDKKTENMISKILGLLIAGPANKSLQQTLPEGTEVLSVTVSGKKAIIDFNSSLTEDFANVKAMELVVATIVNSVTELKDIETVTITVEGKDLSGEYDFDLTDIERNISIVADIEDAAAELDYEEVYADVDPE